MVGKSYRSDQAHGTALSPILATLSVAMCRSCPRVATLYAHPFHFFFFHPLTDNPLTYVMHSRKPPQKNSLIPPLFSRQVFQWQQDNPGVWPFHCHIAWHLSGGLYANIMERPADIENVVIPSTSYQNCRDWVNYSGGNLLPQIDSGL